MDETETRNHYAPMLVVCGMTKQADAHKNHDVRNVTHNRSLLFGFRYSGRRATPNEPKLSHGGAWRGSCGARRRRDMRARKECGTDETSTSVKSQLP